MDGVRTQDVLTQNEGKTSDTTVVENTLSHIVSGDLISSPNDFLSAVSSSGAQSSLVYQESLQDIAALTYLYQKKADPSLLVVLVQRLAASYQFADANTYLQLLMKQPHYEKLLDVKVVLYILFHDPKLGLDDVRALDMLSSLITQYRQQGLLTADDYAWYQ